MAVEEATHEQLGCLGSGGVLGGWRLSQMSPRPELGSHSRSHSHGSFVFIIDLEELRETWLWLSTVSICDCFRSIKALKYPAYVWELYSSTFGVGFQLTRTSPAKN